MILQKNYRNYIVENLIKKKKKSKNVLITYSKVDSYYGKKFLYYNYEVTLDKKKKDFVTLKIKMG
jgi:hypothetical protein